MGQETSRFENVRLLKVWACAGFECEGLVKGLCSAFSRGVFPSLEHIEIATKMGGVSLVNLCQALQAHPRSLKVIELSRCSFTSDSIEALIGLATSSRVPLEKLRLSYSTVTDEGMEILATALAEGEAFTKLTELDLFDNIVTDKGCKILVKAITAGKLTQ
jgi:Ran GTPase-activating protein (RanGAP) involved in mRNA processing and transport